MNKTDYNFPGVAAAIAKVEGDRFVAEATELLQGSPEMFIDALQEDMEIKDAESLFLAYSLEDDPDDEHSVIVNHQFYDMASLVKDMAGKPNAIAFLNRAKEFSNDHLLVISGPNTKRGVRLEQAAFIKAPEVTAAIAEHLSGGKQCQ